MRQSALALIATVGLVCVLACPALGDVILSTDFTGRTVSGKTASDIPWTTLGVQDPGDLTWVVEDPANSPTDTNLFDTSAAQGHFAPDMNIGNEGPWSVTVPLTLTTPEITLDDVVLDWQHFNNSGALQSVNRGADWTITVTGSSSGLVGEATVQVFGKSGLDTATFATPVVLTDAETYSVKLYVIGSNTDGNNTGLDAVTFEGQLTPEPTSIALLGLGAAGILRRRRR